MEKQVRISAKEYVDLLVDSEKLRRLERAGVDNWDWYEDGLCGTDDELEDLDDFREALEKKYC